MNWISWSLSHCLSTMTELRDARRAAARVYAMIDRQPVIHKDLRDFELGSNLRISPPSAIKLNEQNGLSFDKVSFIYPARPGKPVYETLSLRIRRGETVALVGVFGCGKSTVIQLLERFYECDGISYNGIDIKSLDLR